MNSTNGVTQMNGASTHYHPDMLEVLAAARESGRYDKFKPVHFAVMDRRYKSLDTDEKRSEIKEIAMMIAKGQMDGMIPTVIEGIEEEIRTVGAPEVPVEEPAPAPAIAPVAVAAPVAAVAPAVMPVATPVPVVPPATAIVAIPKTHERVAGWAPVRPAMYMLTTEAIKATATEVEVDGHKEIRYRPIQGMLVVKKSIENSYPIYILRLMKPAVVANTNGVISEAARGDVQIPGVFGLHHLGFAAEMIQASGKHPVVEIWPLGYTIGLSGHEEWFFDLYVMPEEKPDKSGRPVPKLFTLEGK